MCKSIHHEAMLATNIPIEVVYKHKPFLKYVVACTMSDFVNPWTRRKNYLVRKMSCVVSDSTPRDKMTRIVPAASPLKTTKSFMSDHDKEIPATEYKQTLMNQNVGVIGKTVRFSMPSHDIDMTASQNHLVVPPCINLVPLSVKYESYDAVICEQAHQVYPGLPLRDAASRNVYMKVCDTVAYVKERRVSPVVHQPPSHC